MASSGLTMMLGPKLDVQSLNTKSFWTWFYSFFFPVTHWNQGGAESGTWSHAAAMARRGKRSICGAQAAMECWGCYCVARTNSFFLKWGYLQTSSARSPNKECGEGLAVLRCGFAEWQRLTEVFPYYLTLERAQRLHALGIQNLHFLHVSAIVAVLQNKLRWLVLPKSHLYDHVCADVLATLQNPRAYHCFSGESYMGFLKCLCQATSMAPNMEERVLKRSLLKVVTACHAGNNGQAELASIQMPLSVGKISWVQCGRVTNLKETNIPLYNFIMILIYGSSGSSLEPWSQWFLELRPGYLGERVLGVLG